MEGFCQRDGIRSGGAHDHPGLPFCGGIEVRLAGAFTVASDGVSAPRLHGFGYLLAVEVVPFRQPVKGVVAYYPTGAVDDAYPQPVHVAYRVPDF